MDPEPGYDQLVASGERFEFGANWERFLSVLDERRISDAIESLQSMLGCETLAGLTFLDIGSGSGLFSLAARRLGAAVHSFDYDPQSVACTREVRRRYAPDDPMWQVERGSVLDAAYVEGLGQHDIVYAWGVLHHTGSMWEAVDNACGTVAPGGLLFIALYNDQGATSHRWCQVKRLYNHLPRALRWLILLPAAVSLWGPKLLRDTLRGRPLESGRRYASKNNRGMSAWRDLVDWVGGYPFEVARPTEVVQHCEASGFTLAKSTDCGGGSGCNEFVFRSTRTRDSEERPVD